MTIRQRILKWVYPLFLSLSKLKSSKKTLHNKHHSKPKVSFYSLSAQLNSGNNLSFEQMRGKKVLIVNTASNCGYTNQYQELQKLYQHAKENLEIIAFPANDFKEQEKGNDDEIAKFCSINYGVQFPIAKKSSVTKNENQNNIFSWLTNKQQNGWNNDEPHWNFSKYLINEEGILTHYFHPVVSPLSEEVLEAIRQ